MTKILSLLLLIGTAQAGEFTACWEYSTTREDGTALKREEIKASELRYQCGKGFPTTLVTSDTCVTVRKVYGLCNVKVRLVDTNDIPSQYTEEKQVILNPRAKGPTRGGFR